MSYHTMFTIAFVAHTAGDWTHLSFVHILLGSLFFAAAFVVTWAGIDKLFNRPKPT